MLHEKLMKIGCPICGASGSRPYHAVDGYQYFECEACESLFVDPHVIDEMDGGRPVLTYDKAYWDRESKESRERSFGPALSRVAETLLYARLPVQKFLDIGSGPGFLLDALSTYLPASRDIFWGIERFPPEKHSEHPNYVIGSIADLPGTFHAGVCIEVIEHLTPMMLRDLIAALAPKSEPNSIYLFNTGLSSYVKNENREYLDPIGRGHIISWGFPGLARLFEAQGFRLIPLPGKSWAFLAEYQPLPDELPIDQRIWSPVEDNKRILHDPVMGAHMYVVGIDTARAYR
jgi:hypothetical protein